MSLQRQYKPQAPTVPGGPWVTSGRQDSNQYLDAQGQGKRPGLDDTDSANNPNQFWPMLRSNSTPAGKTDWRPGAPGALLTPLTKYHNPVPLTVRPRTLRMARLGASPLGRSVSDNRLNVPAPTQDGR